jgi:hypothetical protein
VEKATNTRKILLPLTLETISEKAFINFNNLSRIIIPKNVWWIGNNAFANCENLEYADIMSDRSDKWLGIDLSFVNCPKLKCVIFRTKKIVPQYSDKSIFRLCDELEDIFVPWSKGEVDGEDKKWGAKNATIHYNWEG